jgi:hypothetical protein
MRTGEPNTGLLVTVLNHEGLLEANPPVSVLALLTVHEAMLALLRQQDEDEALMRDLRTLDRWLCAPPYKASRTDATRYLQLHAMAPRYGSTLWLHT